MATVQDRLTGWTRVLSRRVRRGWSPASAAQTGPPRSIEKLPAANWRTVLAALPDAAVLLNGNSVVLDFNGKAAELFSQLSVGIQISAASRNPDLLDGIGLIRDGGEQITVAMNERVPLERNLMATLSKVSTDGGSSAAPVLLIIIRDLTQSRRIESLRTDFVANASHELRTPLASIIGFIETLQGPAKNDPGARDKFLTVMSTQAQRMKRLVDDLMSLTKVEMHAHVMPRGLVDLNSVIDHVREALQPLAAVENVRLTVSPLGAPAMVQGDRDELVQVFQNLIHNGIRYGRTGGSVTVRVDPAMPGSGPKRSTGRFLRVQIADDGPGIAPQHLPRLTERFYRVDVAASRKKEGTGLGLAIAKHVVNRHRGELDIRSEVGKGSVFTVMLPEAVVTHRDLDI